MIHRSSTQNRRIKREQKWQISHTPVMLTPLVDMFVILLIFLLMSYSTGGQLMYMAKNILMPESISREQLEPSVEIAVATDRIYVDGQVIMEDLTALHKEKKLLIPELYASLKEKSLKLKKMEEKVPLFRYSGKVTIQADRVIPYFLLKKILYTADRADFTNISLAVFQRD